MSVTFGFYNSLNGDRKHNATQMSTLFDGIINDGIFMSIGTSMMVKAKAGMTVNIGEGRAWFDHTWTNNSAVLPLTLAPSDLLLNRIDAIVLEVNGTESVRANDIKVVKGTPSSVPVKPAMVETHSVHQHPLCYITLKAGVTEITQGDIENRVGTSECPFVTGVLETMDVDALIAQWEGQWQTWVAETQKENADWTKGQREAYLAWAEQIKVEIETWMGDMTRLEREVFTWLAGAKAEIATLQSFYFYNWSELKGCVYKEYPKNAQGQSICTLTIVGSGKMVAKQTEWTEMGSAGKSYYTKIEVFKDDGVTIMKTATKREYKTEDGVWEGVVS